MQYQLLSSILIPILARVEIKKKEKKEVFIIKIAFFGHITNVHWGYVSTLYTECTLHMTYLSQTVITQVWLLFDIKSILQLVSAHVHCLSTDQRTIV